MLQRVGVRINRRNIGRKDDEEEEVYKTWTSMCVCVLKPVSEHTDRHSKQHRRFC
jgi:hypothetical protein